MWLILYIVWELASSEVLWGFGILSSHVFGHLRSLYQARVDLWKTKIVNPAA